jgi:predicted ATP-grasp superfamily ATP-dependent carboligase
MRPIQRARPEPHRCDILVTNAWGRAAYNVVRSLARESLDVVVGTDRFLGMATLSRYPAARFRHPFATLDSREFVARVEEALRRYRPRVYLPTAEDTYVVSRHLERLKAIGPTAIPVAPFHTIKRLHKKNEVTALAASLGIPTPATIMPSNSGDIRAFCAQYGAPVVLKRISSSGARGVFYLDARDVRDLNGAAPDGAQLGSDFMLQQYVPGTGYGVSMLFNRGRLRASFTHRRLREKTATGGISTIRVGVVQRELEEYARRLLESVKFHGVAMVEFKHDERTGKSWLIEVNPRFWGSLGLAIQSGVDFPNLLYRMALDGDVEPVTTYRTGLVVRWLLGDIGARMSAVLGRRPRDGADPTSAACDDFYWDDPVPFVGGAVLSLWKFLETRKWPAHDVDLSIDELD